MAEYTKGPLATAVDALKAAAERCGVEITEDAAHRMTLAAVAAHNKWMTDAKRHRLYTPSPPPPAVS